MSTATITADPGRRAGRHRRRGIFRCRRADQADQDPAPGQGTGGGPGAQGARPQDRASEDPRREGPGQGPRYYP
jgi:hypothetical protein